MKSLAAVLTLALCAASAAAADGAGTQSPGANTNAPGSGTGTPGATGTPGSPGSPSPSPNLQPSPDGQTPSMWSPGSTPSPSPTPGTEFPSQHYPTAPNQTGTLNGGTPAQRTRSQLLTDVRSAILQVPGANQQGVAPGAKVEEMRIQDLRVFRRGGRIILSGSVATQAEKDSAGARATQAARGQTVINQLEVK